MKITTYINCPYCHHRLRFRCVVSGYADRLVVECPELGGGCGEAFVTLVSVKYRVDIFGLTPVSTKTRQLPTEANQSPTPITDQEGKVNDV